MNPAFAWNHGDYQQDIATTWLGVVGPGVRSRGVDSRTWTDHTNVRPTILALTGLADDYLHDGRVLVEGLERRATPKALGAHREAVARLGQAYEQLNASFGAFALQHAPGLDHRADLLRRGQYERIEGRIAELTQERDALAGRIKSQLDAAAFDGRRIDERQARIETLLAWGVILRAKALAAGHT